jgi:hypothetical protein
MNLQTIRYTVVPEHADKNEALIRAVFAELRQSQPDGLRYAAFRLSDGVSFLHLTHNKHADQPSPLLGVEAFRAFQEGFDERRADGPRRETITAIGSYRVFEAE